MAKRYKFFNKYRKYRSLLKRELYRGERRGFKKAQKNYDDLLKVVNQSHLNQTKCELSAHTKEKGFMRDEQKKEILQFKQTYEDKRRRNQKAFEQALEKTSEAKDRYERAENYYRERAADFQTFMNAVQPVLRQASDRFEILHKNMNQVSVDQESVEKLQASFNKIMRTGVKERPKLQDIMQ